MFQTQTVPSSSSSSPNNLPHCIQVDGHVSINQINLQHSTLATANLAYMISSRPSIFLVQEPWVYKGRFSGLPAGLTIYFKSSPNLVSPRAAIIAPVSSPLLMLEQFSGRDSVTCSWSTGPANVLHPEIFLISSYWDINLPSPPSEMLASIDFCISHGIPYVCALDSNAHSTLWGSPYNNHRGDLLEDLISSKNMSVQNRGSIPTFHTSRGKSHIDVTLSSQDIDPIIHRWQVSSELSFSDHRLINFRIKLSLEEPVRIRPLGRCDWPLFSSLLASEFVGAPTEWTPSILEDCTHNFYQKVNQALDGACPEVVFSPSKNLSWWNGELGASRKAVRRAFQLASSCPSMGAWDSYKECVRSHKKLVKKSKRDSWRKFSSEVSTASGMSFLKKIIFRNGNAKAPCFVKDKHGTITTSINDSLSSLLEHHFPHGSNSAGFPLPVVTDLPSVSIPHYDWLSVDRIRKAFSSFSDNKTPGPDNIKPIILKNLPDSALSYLSKIFSASIFLGYTPSPWRISRTIFIPKVGKADYSDCGSFRPISLMSFCFKTLERLVHWEMENTALKSHPFHRHQHGFRRGFGTDTALSEVVNFVEQGILKNKRVLAVFLDIKGAFDNASSEAIRKAMEDHGYPRVISSWYYNFLKSRVNFTSRGSIMILRLVFSGTPQGGVLSPIVWNLIYDAALVIMNRAPTLGVGFADDGTVLIAGYNLTLMSFHLQKVINELILWGRDCGLTFSTDKSNVVLFSTERNPPCAPVLKMYGSVIPAVSSVKYLGIHLTSNLSWSLHINLKLSKAKKLLNISRSAFGSFWGPSPKLTKWIFDCVVRPVITYGSHVWSHGLKETSKSFQTLNKIQRLALLPLAPIRVKTPTAGLEIITGTLPLDLHIKNLNLNTYLRIKNKIPVLWDGVGMGSRRGHLFHLSSQFLGCTVAGIPMDRIPTVVSWTKLYKIFLDYDPLSLTIPTLRIFTDGSRTGGKSGYGLLFQQSCSSSLNPQQFSTIHEDSGPLGSLASVFQAEVHAIIEALKHLVRISAPNQENRVRFGPILSAHIFCDSQSALKALDSHLINSHQILECRNLLNAMGRRLEISLYWIKAHAGNIGNERADVLAKQGATTSIVGPAPFILCSHSFIKAFILEDVVGVWSLRWKNLLTCRQTKIWFPVPDLKKSAKLLALDRAHLGVVIRFITGHNFLMRHNNLLMPDMFDDPLCRLCYQDEETSFHILGDCEPLGGIRYRIFQRQILQNPPLWKVGQLLKMLDHPAISSLEISYDDLNGRLDALMDFDQIFQVFDFLPSQS